MEKSNLIKNGKTYKGIQTYFNKETGKYVREESLRPPEKLKLLSTYLYINGLSSRTVARILGVTYSSVLRWSKKYSDFLNFKDTFDKNIEYNDVEIDEMFTFLLKKRKNYISGLQSIENQEKS